MKPLAIIGLDPGTTTAYAILSLNGKVIELFSARDTPLSTIITKIYERCRPLVVATDKQNSPSFVEEFSRKTGAKLICPEEDLTREQKRELVIEFMSGDMSNDVTDEKLYQNTHEFDSLAAALFAYKSYLSKLTKINKFLAENKLEPLRSEFTLIALKQEDLNFWSIKDLLTMDAETKEITRTIIAEEKFTPKNFLRLCEKITAAKHECAVLKNKLSAANKEIAGLKRTNSTLTSRSSNFDHRVDSLFKFKEDRIKLQEKEIAKRNETISALHLQFQVWNKFIALCKHNFLLKKAANLSQEAYNSLNQNVGIQEGDFIWVEQPAVYSEKVIQELTAQEAIIAAPGNIPKNISAKLSTIQLSQQEFLMEIGHFALADPELIKRRLNEKQMIFEVIQSYKQERQRPK